jgi:glc operon protein GlcG
MKLLFLVAIASDGVANGQIAEKKALTLDGAKRVIAAASLAAKQKNAPGAVVAVVDDGGNPIALERLDGTFAAGANISLGKARTAVLFKPPTKAFEDIIRNGRTPMIALNDFTPLQGGVPIMVDGQILGGVGVSGAASAEQDEEIAIAGANAAKEFAAPKTSSSNANEVTFFEKKSVDAAFAKGAVLFDGNGDRNYMVHASRREKPGQAEVHTKDADVIHVLSGGATFVTGGTVIDGKNIAPDEIRGSGIEGGESRQLAQGDVIIVPNGVPHWFKEINGPFLYYVVKVR